MIAYDNEVIWREMMRLREDLRVLIFELPEPTEELSASVVTGMAIAYKLVRAMITARADHVIANPPLRRYPPVNR